MTRPNGDLTEHCLHCGQEVILGKVEMNDGDVWRIAQRAAGGILTGSGFCTSPDGLHHPIPDTTDMAALEAWLEETP